MDGLEFDDLIKRLKRHSEWKYPDRPWTLNFHDQVRFMWTGKEEQLKEKVLSLEDDMRNAGVI